MVQGRKTVEKTRFTWATRTTLSIIGTCMLVMVFFVNLVFANIGDELMAKMRSGSSRVSAGEVAGLIQQGGDVNAADNTVRGEWITPLMYAAMYNPKPDVFLVLIENGADVNADDKKAGRTPLMYAAMYNSNLEILRVLIENGANVDAIDKNGYRASDYALENKNFEKMDVHFLFAGKMIPVSVSETRPAEIQTEMQNIRKSQFIDPIPSSSPKPSSTGNRKAATEKLLSVTGSPRVSAGEITRLIKEGADVNAVGGDGWTPLMSAASSSSSPEVLQILIEKGARVNAASKNGTTPLMCAAAENSNSKILRALIEKGANVKAVDKDGKTPLMWAAEYNSNPEVLRILIVNGSVAAAKDKFGKRAFDYAEKNRALKQTGAYLLLREKTIFQ